LKADVGSARQALHADLVKVRELVQKAREAVHKVAIILAQIHGVGNNSTSTATTTPTSTATTTPTSTATTTPTSTATTTP